MQEIFEDLEFSSNWKFQTRAALSHKMAALKFFCEITQKSSFNSQYSERRSLKSETVSGNWKPLKNNEKCFLFHQQIKFGIGKSNFAHVIHFD